MVITLQKAWKNPDTLKPERRCMDMKVFLHKNSKTQIILGLPTQKL